MLVLLAALACSGAGDTDKSDSAEATDAGTCDAFTACGGDLVGTWTFSTGCLGATGSPLDNCSDATVAYTITPTGTITFSADQTYSLQVDVGYDAALTVPDNCFPDGATCDDLDGEYGECDAGSGTCECADAGTGYAATETGVWSLQGNAVLLDEDDGLEDTHLTDYCVDGDTLALKSLPRHDGDDLVLWLTRG